MTMKQTEIGTIHNLVNFKEIFLLPIIAFFIAIIVAHVVQ
jgi:hypothetical protein